MTITFPVAFPSSLVPAQFSFMMRSQVAGTRSPFSGKMQIQVHSGQWWELSMAFPPLVRADGEALAAFKAKMNGREGTFTFGDPSAATPRGTASSAPGTPLVDGASQTGSVLNIKGAPNNASTYLLAGDYIQLGSGSTTELYKVLDTVSSDGSGDAAVDIWPKLRTVPSDGATVIVADTVGLWRLAENLSSWDIRPPSLFTHSLSAVEAI